MPVQPSHQPYQGSCQGSSQWCPPEITQAALPLKAVSRVMTALSDDHAALAHLTDSAPTRMVPEAVAHFIEAWRLVLWQLGASTDSLASALHAAAELYRGTEQELTNSLLRAWDGVAG